MLTTLSVSRVNRNKSAVQRGNQHVTRVNEENRVLYFIIINIIITIIISNITVAGAATRVTSENNHSHFPPDSQLQLVSAFCPVNTRSMIAPCTPVTLIALYTVIAALAPVTALVAY
jgi:hypothetical protein